MLLGSLLLGACLGWTLYKDMVTTGIEQNASSYWDTFGENGDIMMSGRSVCGTGDPPNIGIRPHILVVLLRGHRFFAHFWKFLRIGFYFQVWFGLMNEMNVLLCKLLKLGVYNLNCESCVIVGH